MSRLLLLLIFALWLISPQLAPEPAWPAGVGVLVFLGGYALLIGLAAVWARLLARTIGHHVLRRRLRTFDRTMAAARVAVPLWMGFALFGPIGWGRLVHDALAPITTLDFGFIGSPPFALPGLVVGTLPAVLAWIGLWWAQYPADCAFREQGMLARLEQNLPVHSPPPMGRYLLASIRQQLLFVLLPVLLILLLRDVMLVGLWLASPWLAPRQVLAIDAALIFPGAAIVFLFAPEILRRVLKTRPLPDSALRRRLEEICRSSGLKYRQILLWETDFSMGNAAVMGLIPRFRYIMLSDLLLESMTDHEIEAVFAHELGHVVHHHMLWYVVFFVTLALISLGPGQVIDTHLVRALEPWLGQPRSDIVMEVLAGVAVLATILIAFGYLSRRFERQADVFAARMMERNWGGAQEDPSAVPLHHRVGPFGAAIVAQALEQVARINNIPIAARSWCHGSIARRIAYVESLASDPARTGRFDRYMFRLNAFMVAVLVACSAFVAFADA